MAIKVFSDEEKAAAKATASEKFQGACLEVHLAAPINESLIVAPFDRASYSAYSDAEDKDRQSAYSTALMGRVIVPDLVALNTINQAWPVLAEGVAGAMLKEAGAHVALGSCDPLDFAALPVGLTPADAQRLKGEAGGRNLWAVTLKDKSAAFVFATPDPQTWIAARAMYDDASRKGKGSIDAATPYIQGAIVWSSAPLMGGDGLLDLRPAIFWRLWDAYKRIGGEGAAVRTFRF